MEGKEKADSDWYGYSYGSDNMKEEVGRRYGFQLACVRVR